ncbi:Uncharacterised protein [Neisseria meningitidis]|nr:Uncharacterised protein [Neisseria meningitidis]
MVVRQSQIHHWTDNNLTVFNHSALFSGMHTQNRRLRRVDDRGRHHRTESTAVGNTECTAGQIFDSDFAIFGFFRVINNCLFDVGNAHLVGIAQDWHNQTAWAANRDTDVEVAVVHDVFAVNRSIHNRVFFQGGDSGFNEEGHKAQFHAVFFLEFFFVLRTQVHDWFHVDFVECSQNGVFLLRSQEAFCNTGTQAAHWYAFFRTCAGRGCGCGRFGSGILYVFFQYATVTAGTLQCVHVNTGLRSQFGGGRHSGVVLCGSRSGSRGGFGRSGYGCFGSGSSSCIDACQNLVGNNGFTVLRYDFNQYAGLWGRDFQNHFVRFDIDQDFVTGNCFANFFLPFQERAFRYAFRQHRYFYINNHFVSPMALSDGLLCVFHSAYGHSA